MVDDLPTRAESIRAAIQRRAEMRASAPISHNIRDNIEKTTTFVASTALFPLFIFETGCSSKRAGEKAVRWIASALTAAAYVGVIAGGINLCHRPSSGNAHAERPLTTACNPDLLSHPMKLTF